MEEERTATRLHNKFLDLKINDCIQGFRENHKNEYKVIFDFLQFMGSLKDNFIGKDASQRDIFLLSSIIELNRLFQSAVLLFERGLPESANIIIRTILELSLNIVETIKNENYIQEIIFSEIKEARSTVNIAKEFNRLDLIPLEKIQEIEETYNLLVKSDYNKKSVKDLAQKNGFEVEYLLYRTYSGNTHTSASTLAKNFNITPLGIIFDADIQVNDFKYGLRRLLSIVIISLPTLIDDYFDDGDLKNKYNLICDDFERVFNN